MLNFFLQISRWLNRFLILLGLRSNPDFWGTVYDSVTKQPIDPVMVKLVEVASGAVIGTSTTDLYGHYSFLAFPGKFKILVQRTNYRFPSQLQLGDNDGVYENLYHGEFFEVTGETDMLNLNIPMDPLRPDWNQQAKRKLARINPRHQLWLTYITFFLFWTGFIASLVVCYFNPSARLYAVLIIYASILLLSWLLPRFRLWGRIVLPNGADPMRFQVELAHSELPDVLIGKSLIFPDGKFYLRVPAGKYILRVVSRGSGTRTVLAGYPVRVGWEGIVNQTFKINPS